MKRLQIIVKSDGEEAIKALAKMVQQRRALLDKIDGVGGAVGTIIEEAPKNDSASLGVGEKAVQEVEGHVRTWLSYIEDKMKTTIEGGSPLIPWLIQHTGSTLNRTKVGEDGKLRIQELRARSQSRSLFHSARKYCGWSRRKNSARIRK